MATAHRIPPQPSSNGVITAPAKGVVGGNRKKQKRRAKQAAKAASQPITPTNLAADEAEIDYDEDPLGYNDEDDYEYSDADQQHFHHQNFAPTHHSPGANGYDMPVPNTGKKNRRKKKKAGGDIHGHDPYGADLLSSRLPDPPGMAVQKRGTQQNIWNTSTQQERQNIKNFWLSLSEEERKSLLKIEKEAVLRKMKQQQKHSCSCTVCGRKRTAIEEELEVLYEGYYEELEQYAHHDHPPLPTSSDMMLPAPLSHAHRPHPLAAPPPPPPQSHPHHRSSQMLEHLDDEEDYSDAEEEYSDEEYSEEEPEPPRGPIPDFFNFGQNLTVKDNLLTVADDLLKNDGRKFIEMMEQLAERRMQRENEAEYAAANPGHGGYHPNDGGYNNDNLGPDDDYDDEDEASYDSQEDYDDELEEEDDMSGLTEEQRMQEGRRMFQIFAARMFEHRVLTAYKEKVAAERQQKLLEELQDEEKLEAQREAKKKRDAEKKKDKKKQQQAAKAEEKAKRDAEKAAEEARIKELEEKKAEEQRRRKEEQRRKKEDEKRKLEEDRLKKEADRQRRQQEEQQRREEAERKSRELKAAEKARKEEARKREKEERDARDKTVRERKAQQDDTERREREAKLKSEPRKPESAQPQVAKRASHQNMVAVPGVFPKQPTPGAVASPKAAVATPAMPKAPVTKKQGSQQGSHASSPKQTQSQVSSAPSKSSSPGSAAPTQHPPGFPKTILQKPATQPQPQAHPLPLPQQHMQPPPGMPHVQQANGFTPMPGIGFPPGVPGGMRSPMPMFPPGGPPLPVQGRMASFGGPGINGIHGPPPGMMPHGRNNGFPYEGTSPNAPPGFGAHMPQTPISHTSPIGPPINGLPQGQEVGRGAIGTHSRQHSLNDKFDATVGHAVPRPAPIQRPSSVKPQDNADIDDLSKHLGSSALLADADDDDLQQSLGRRASQRTGPLDGLGGFGSAAGGFGAPGSAWPTQSPFGQSPGLGQQWNNMPAGGWNSNSFGSISGVHRPSLQHTSNRPLTIRIAVCHACKQLAQMTHGGNVFGGENFHHIDALLQQIEYNRPPLDSLPTLREIEDICETEGDAQNGGGELQTRKGPKGNLLGVRWRADALTPDLGRQNGHGSLGEIGSPLPAKSTPAIGFGAPGMGRAGTGSMSGWTSLGH